ncbi:hypothetical protein Xgly_07560 [Xanthomonas citri pv. glycines]|uniref:Uncharacterized protein n=1 Tax=Xanthomonas campestris pv. glycines TaxID=473421 RepID=A0AAX0I2P5_XANCG|nr:hypothetical protein BHE84_01590 [Xanthomonas citri pv. glycines str. 8ra]ARV21085.1 hypothetical protein A9D66_00295 [Xanthomonas citri pv. glycines str. 12-2]OEY91114.1 hypothetical protein BIY41_00295 [Xanthomonas citri pv. glycines]OOX05221.1 hypothetical protein Xgly_07560 [Xanthomonas citri pv. glycines]QDR43349.1 hypothetical protein FPK90_00315 [Xanthomonas citri pv. glycines]
MRRRDPLDHLPPHVPSAMLSSSSALQSRKQAPQPHLLARTAIDAETAVLRQRSAARADRWQ